MSKVMTAAEAVQLIKNGDTIGINAFLTLANPEALHTALAERIQREGAPHNLELFCTTGFGGWNEDRYADQVIRTGAVRSVVAGHFGSMPAAMRLISEGRMQGYNMPQGVMTQMQRAAAANQPGVLSDIGLNLFVDPRLEGPGMSRSSREEWVRLVEFAGQPTLFYRAPKIDVAFIRGTSADARGNISFENECVIVDALSLAQATRANGGKVIVQVERVSDVYQRPRSIIIPGVLVDAIVVDAEQMQSIAEKYNPALSGEMQVAQGDMEHWQQRLEKRNELSGKPRTESEKAIARRAVREMRKGDVVNIGIGVSEEVASIAAKSGMLREITLTVESGAIGGLPASGYVFGATIGADVIYEMSEQFDFYDGGGLDICFVGAMEFDAAGNVNSHRIPGRMPGIGGFANITTCAKRVVFCMSFSAGGLEAEVDGRNVRILREGRIKKLVPRVTSVSFSALNARNRGQEVLYVTERCVFRLGEHGLVLTEIAPGVDLQRDILDQLDFPVRVASPLQEMVF